MLNAQVLRVGRFLQISATRNSPLLTLERKTFTTYYPLGGQQEMETKTEDQPKKMGDVMEDSFGEGYSTRSDEEGFGGTYGGNTEEPQPTHEKKTHDYDQSQGSTVTEKEKGRNRKDSNA